MPNFLFQGGEPCSEVLKLLNLHNPEIRQTYQYGRKKAYVRPLTLIFWQKMPSSILLKVGKIEQVILILELKDFLSLSYWTLFVPQSMYRSCCMIFFLLQPAN